MAGGGCIPAALSSPQNSVVPFSAVPGRHRSLSHRHLCLPLVPSWESVHPLCRQGAWRIRSAKVLVGRARGSDTPQMQILLSKRSKGTLLYIPNKLKVPQIWLSFSILVILQRSAPEMSTLKKKGFIQYKLGVPPHICLIQSVSSQWECFHLHHVHRNHFDPIFPHAFLLYLWTPRKLSLPQDLISNFV